MIYFIIFLNTFSKYRHQHTPDMTDYKHSFKVKVENSCPSALCIKKKQVKRKND